MSEILLAVQGVIVTAAFTFVVLVWRSGRSLKSSRRTLNQKVS